MHWQQVYFFVVDLLKITVVLSRTHVTVDLSFFSMRSGSSRHLLEQCSK